MDLLVSTSMVAAFIAGLAALFAPCCITVLLPSYLASVFREKRTVFLMTFIFFLGILLVFLPLGLGAAFFGQLLSKYHNAIFIVGGAFLLFSGLVLLMGKHYSLPFHVNPALKNHHAISVFILGIFSGIATTCCAPVLAGVLALAVLPGSIFLGAAYTLSYVLGMVAPLFFISIFLDKTNIMRKLTGAKKQVKYSMFGRRISATIAEIIAGAMFVVMGLLTVILAFTNKLQMRSSFQIDINIFSAKLFNVIKFAVVVVPEWAWALFFLAILIGLTIKVFYLFKKEKQQYDEKQ
ncbi:MAG: hypothetical protein HY569_02260 [Candidatus Magasanikbacteria bacterium]|nr:hypothetical protein [Candidatus Magasanikbacteria bacterium]